MYMVFQIGTILICNYAKNIRFPKGIALSYVSGWKCEMSHCALRQISNFPYANKKPPIIFFIIINNKEKGGMHERTNKHIFAFILKTSMKNKYILYYYSIKQGYRMYLVFQDIFITFSRLWSDKIGNLNACFMKKWCLW